MGPAATWISVEKARISSNQVADSLQWAAYALILVFLAQVIAALFPIALLQPQWMVRFSAALRGTASLPMLALALVLVANMIDGGVLPSSRQIQKMRRIASIASLGFLLLIPLQSYATVRTINSQVQERQDQLNKVIAAANQIQKASTEQELRLALQAIPGGEELSRRPLGADVQTVKTALLQRLRPSVKRFETQLKEVKSKALENIITPLIRDGLISLAYALGFAGLGFSSAGKPNLLRRIIKSRNPDLQRELGATWPGLPRRPD